MPKPRPNLSAATSSNGAARTHFRVLKSGRKTEYPLFRTADRVQRTAINAVIAWRIMHMILVGRQAKECTAELMFPDRELAFLSAYAIQADSPCPMTSARACNRSRISAATADKRTTPNPETRSRGGAAECAYRQRSGAESESGRAGSGTSTPVDDTRSSRPRST